MIIIRSRILGYLINYFYDNYLNDESYSAMINYDVTSEDQIVLMRTNNSCEGYHNRLRNIIKFSHSSPAYVITKLISEEDEFRKLTIGIVSRKKNCLKKVKPTHLDISTKTPAYELFCWLTDYVKKKTQNKIFQELDIQDFEKIATMEDLKEMITIIEMNIFETDVVEETEEISK